MNIWHRFFKIILWEISSITISTLASFLSYPKVVWSEFITSTMSGQKNHLYPHFSDSMHFDTVRIAKIMAKDMYIGAPLLSAIPVITFEMNLPGTRKTFHSSWCDTIFLSSSSEIGLIPLVSNFLRIQPRMYAYIVCILGGENYRFYTREASPNTY